MGRVDVNVTNERISSGVERLDTMLGGGYYRGANVLISGISGTAKTTLSGAFAEAACRRHERTMFVSFNSDGTEVTRNLASVGIRLDRYVRDGCLKMISARTITGSAEHFLARIKTLAKRDIASGQITGMEALLRWHHPDLGMVAPMQFIPVAEETGLIVPIGKWVINTACMQNAAWQKQGLAHVSIAVNLTARQFFDEHLLRDVDAILKTTGMDPLLLEIEIHESLLIRDIEKTLAILRALKAMRIRIAIDDFGVGYSSLATLQRFPLDTIKIDRSFIRDVAALGEDRTLTQAIIAMGKSLSLTVVAQGVETKEQADFLRQHACDEFQGFYFNKPVSADQFTELLRAQKTSTTYTGSRAAQSRTAS